MENITGLALPLLNEDARPDSMEDDWIVNFLAKGRIVSNEEMQTLWARILAGEANAPGSYSKRTVNILSDFDKSDAELFGVLCGFVWRFSEDPQPLVFNYRDSIYRDHGLKYHDLQHLESVGLISFNDRSYAFHFFEGENPVISYYGRSLTLDASHIGTDFSVGHVLLTRFGAELVGICGGEEVQGFYKYALDQLPNQFVPMESTGNAQKKANDL